ncbi:MAG TPA: hypothetical protein PLC08_00040 [Candidatus Bipolaricaulis sp.]|nr:hypothetical protein [Candidatus Bipolaricaulis sp.]HRS14577.1 hypothetical protein [Candidatus Bipolaricaulis sp.]HRU21659.1 hypothetical protein [Candidatus Bipolaricaulis sp.]
MEELDRLREQLDGFSRHLRKLKTTRINTERDKKYVRDLVTEYFRELRPVLADFCGSETELHPLDTAMQELLRCTQKQASVQRYRDLIRSCQSTLNDLEVRLVKEAQRLSTHVAIGSEETLILATLQKVNPSAAAAYAQGLEDLRAANRKSWRGTIVELREALRETLDTLVPDDEVKAHRGFQPEAGTTHPTMKQKVEFLLRSRRATKSQAKAAADSADVVDQAVARFVRSVYDRASTGVHNEVSKDEAIRLKKYVTIVLAELLEVRE